jgi:hypothetical protein
MPDKIQYTPTAEEERFLRSCQPERLSLSQVAHRDWQRLHWLLSQCVPTFLEAEALLICEALHPLIPAGSPELVLILSSWVSQQVQKRKVQAHPEMAVEALLSRLEHLGPGECLALWYAVERYWLARARDEHASAHELLRDVGLVPKGTHSSASVG